MSDSFEDNWSDTEQTELGSFSEPGLTGRAAHADLTQYQGCREDHTGYTFDNVNTSDDPPMSWVPEPWCDADPAQMGGEIAFTLAGDTYTYATDSDIIFNDDLVWYSDDQIRAGQCNNGYSSKASPPRDRPPLGHGPLLRGGRVCPDLDMRYATMYWANSNCTLNQSLLKTDDVEGITALYGPYAPSTRLQAQRWRPLDVCFELESMQNAGIAIEWNFGDGTISEEPIEFELDEDGEFVLNEDGNKIIVLSSTPTTMRCTRSA